MSKIGSLPELTDEVKAVLAKGQRSESMEVTVEGQTVTVQYEEVKPEGDAKVDVLLLHSGVYTSKVWLDTTTLYFLAQCGCRAVAIDLPGKGGTKPALPESAFPAFLPAVISALDMNKPIIISPSSSGKYSMPFLFGEGVDSQEKSRGFVPIAPHKTGDYKQAYPSVKIPTLIVYGVNDAKGPETFEDLKMIPNHCEARIQDSGHPCYAEQTVFFHQALFIWLSQL